MPYAPGTLVAPAQGPSRDEREKERKRWFDERRGSAASRGYDSRWRKARIGYLRRHPLCVHCEAEGVVCAASVVDHIVPHRGDRRLFWDRANWQSLCAEHHNRKTATEDSNFTAGNARSLYWPEGLRPSRPVLTIVSGPPGSGKTTWVRSQAERGDVVIDLDDIVAEQTGSPYRVASWDVLNRALAERNRRLRSLATSEARRAWFIVTAPTHVERARWQRLLGARVVAVICAPADVCKGRIMSDPLRVSVSQGQCVAVDRWMARYRLSGEEQVVCTA